MKAEEGPFRSFLAINKSSGSQVIVGSTEDGTVVCIKCSQRLRPRDLKKGKPKRYLKHVYVKKGEQISLLFLSRNTAQALHLMLGKVLENNWW